MPRQQISSGSSFEDLIAYSRAVVDGEWIFVSGTTGYDYKAMNMPTGIEEQVEQAMLNVSNALVEAGSSMKDVVRIRYILPNAKEFPLCWPILRNWLGDVRPAATMFQAGLMEETMKFEVEVTAKRQS